MEDKYEHIHKASNTLLADMLEQDETTSKLRIDEYLETRKEAARRLRASDRHEPRKPFFNDEQFNI